MRSPLKFPNAFHEVSNMEILKKIIPDRGKSNCRGLERGMFLVCSRKNKGSMIGAVSMWERGTRKDHRKRQGDRLYGVFEERQPKV